MEENEQRKKIERLYYKYRNALYREAYSILHNETLSEDAVSDTFEKIILNLHKIDEDAPAKTFGYLRKICWNAAKNINKKQNREAPDEKIDEFVSNAPSIEEKVIDKDEKQKLADKIKSLTPIYRDVIILKYAKNMTYQEIADILKIKISVVEKRIARAKKELKRKYGRWDNNETR